MKGEVSPDPESLVAHRGFVEALARRLVDDRHVAEDLVQETFLAALRRPPRAAAALRGFLARVLRNQRARWLRDEERRLRKEHAAARPDRHEGGGDLVARLSWHRKVVDTLLALEEPYRTTLLLRFYEDLKPGAIAERLDVPPGTVRARLSRGLERMRARLDADHEGDRRSWQLGLLPLLSCARPRGVLLGVAAMTAGKKVVTAAALVLALAGTGYVTLRTLQREAPPARSDAPRGAVTVAEVDRAPDPKSIPAEQGSTLVVHVRNERDEPIAGAEVVVLRTIPDPESITTSSVDERRWAEVSRHVETVATRRVTDGSGTADLRGLRGNRWDIVAMAPGRGSARRTVLGQQELPIVLRLGAARSLRGRVVDTAGAPIPFAVVLAGTPPLAWERQRPERPFRAVAGEHGEYALDALPAEDVSVFAAFPGGLAIHVATLRFPGPERFDIVLRRGAKLAGTVADGSGRPVAGADVFVHGTDYPKGAPRDCPGHARTDDLGRYVIDTLPPCTLNRATVEAHGHVVARGLKEVVQLVEGETATLDFTMSRSARIRGTALGPDGPVSGLCVVSLQRSPGVGVIQRSARTDAEGRFVLENLPPGRVVVQVAGGGHRQEGFPADPWNALLTADEDTPWLVTIREGEELDYVARLDRGELVVEGTVFGPDGQPFGGAEVFAAGVTAESAEDGSFRLENVFADAGVVRVAAPGMRQVGPWPKPESLVILRLEAAPDPRLVGSVRGPAGAPVEGAFLLLAEPGAFYRSGRNPRYATVEEERRWYTASRHPVPASGSFDIPLRGIAEKHRQIWLRAGAPGMADAGPVEVELDQERMRFEVNLVLAAGSTLRGIVVGGSAGEALADARVTVRRPRPVDEPVPAGALGESEAVAAITTGTGEFEVRDLGPGWWEIVASASGFVDGTAKVELPSQRPARIALLPTLSIRGRVVLQDGTPVPFAFVQVDGMPGSLAPLSHRVSSTDAGGLFAADDLTPGRYGVRVAASGRVNIVEANARDVPAGSADLRIVVERGLSVSGIVVDAKGRGVPLLSITAQTPGAPSAFGQARDDGAFDVRGLREGTYTLLFHGANRTEKTQVVVRDVRAGTEGLRVTFAPEADERLSIDGILVDEAGTPLPGRWIGTTAGKRGMTDDAGRFAIAGLDRGKHALVLERGGYDVAQYLYALCDAEAGATGIRVVARTGEQIGGTVTDGSAPAANAIVVISTGDRSPIFAKTDEAGAFRVSGVPPGATCTVSAGGGVFMRTAVANVVAGTTDVRIVLKRGLTARGRLVDADGAPVAGARVIVSQPGVGGAAGRTDAEGMFLVTGLAPGRYDVRAELQAGDLQDCGTIEAGATDVELRLPAK